MNGGVIGPTNPTTTSTASGVYSVVEAQLDRQNNAFPYFATYTTDTFFNKTKLLIHGDGSLNANNNTIIDTSSQGTTMTRVGTTTQGSFSPYSQTGWSTYHPTAADYYSFPSTAGMALGSSGDATIECWVNFTNLPASGAYIFSKDGVSGTNVSEYSFQTTNALGAVAFTTGNSGGAVSQQQYTVGTLAINTWYHIAACRTGTTWYIFLNGTLVNSGGTIQTVAPVSSGRSFYVGGQQSGGASLAGAYISNLRVVVGTALYLTTFTPSTIPLTAISGTDVLTANINQFADSISGGTITTAGSPWVQPFSPFAPSIAYGVSSVGGSISAIATSDAVTATLSGSPGTTDFSIEFWAYPTSYSSTTNVILFALGAQNAASSLCIFFSTVSTQTAFRYGAGGSGSDYTIGSVPKLNNWTHYAFCRSSGVTAVYVNGVFIANTSAAISGTPTVTATALSLFALSGASQYLGFITGVRYQSGISAYTAAFTPPTSPISSTGNSLLLLNGTNGSIYDSTAKNNIVTSSGGFLSTTQSKFGGSCLRFPGGTAINTMAGPHNSLGQGDYTVEMWIWFDGLGFQRVMGQGTLIAGEFLFIFNPNGSFDWCESGTARVSGAAGATTTNTWYHIAIVRYGLTGTAYVNGQQNGTTYTPATNYNYNATTSIYIGAGGAGALGGQTFAGYIDDLRITVGAARYTGNFTIPSSAYPNQ
jgi:hypothetical protein